jgi:hypothetical protein
VYNLKRTNFIYGTSIFYIKRDMILDVRTMDGEKLKFWYNIAIGKLTIYGDYENILLK